ncbi:F510_1955 family glycosylhydrolase [Bacillus infantis]|uniref:F510_1955 family glycosylhydrolase n=1 Tax=Bacillus infantis TaxID=324767 RepID=UPI003CF430ED
MRLRIAKISLLSFTLLLMLAGCTPEKEEQKSSQEKEQAGKEEAYEIEKAEIQQISNIYGLGYPGNDDALYTAEEDGLKIYKDGQWLEQNKNKHMYTGFQAVESGFIASGKPAEGAGLRSPLGIIKSDDKGATLSQIKFYGKDQFYFLAAGFSGETLYVISQEPESELGAGVFRSTDKGEKWEPAELEGIESDTLGMIAVHPSKEGVMAMSTRSGIFLSNDFGKTVQRVSDPVMTTALAFTEDSLIYSSVENEKILLKSLDLASLETEGLDIPFLSYDNPITYIAANYKKAGTISFSTYLYDIYESADSGGHWNQLLKNGRIK